MYDVFQSQGSSVLFLILRFRLFKPVLNTLFNPLVPNRSKRTNWNNRKSCKKPKLLTLSHQRFTGYVPVRMVLLENATTVICEALVMSRSLCGALVAHIQWLYSRWQKLTVGIFSSSLWLLLSIVLKQRQEIQNTKLNKNQKLITFCTHFVVCLMFKMYCLTVVYNPVLTHESCL